MEEKETKPFVELQNYKYNLIWHGIFYVDIFHIYHELYRNAGFAMQDRTISPSQVMSFLHH